MSISDTNKAQKYASIAETAAAQAKLYADKLAQAPDYAGQAKQYAEQAQIASDSASSSASAAVAAELSSSQNATEAAQSAAEAESAAQAVFDGSIHAPAGESLSSLPAASSRANTFPVFDSTGDVEVKPLSSIATLDSTGKLPVSVIPAIAITETFVVNSEAEMLALNAETGDVAKRTDLGYSFILSADPASTLSNWVQLNDDVLAQLSQSTGATEVGAVDDDGTPTTVQGALNQKATTQDIDDFKTELVGEIPFKYSASPVQGMESINARPSTRYRIGTFNTYVGYWNNFSTNGDNGYGINVKYIQEMILRYQLDFCGFQEFQSAQSYPISCLAIYPYVGAYFGKVIPISDHNGSSKFNYGNAITYNGSVASTSSAVYTAGATTDKRGYIRTVHSVRGISVAVYVTHLANADATTRQAQMSELATVVSAETASRIIVMGDFNTSVASDFTAFTSIGFTMANNNDVNTSADGTWYIDNILYKGFSSLALKAAGTPYTYISDHKMFYAEFEV